MKLTFFLPGMLPAKQTCQHLAYEKGKLRLLPKEAWQKYRDEAIPFLKEQVNKLPPEIQMWLPIDWAIDCKALFYREHLGGVAAIHYQALAELMRAANLIAHEKWIQSWDGSRLLLDRQHPRIEFVMTRLTKETKRAS